MTTHNISANLKPTVEWAGVRISPEGREDCCPNWSLNAFCDTGRDEEPAFRHGPHSSQLSAGAYGQMMQRQSYKQFVNENYIAKAFFTVKWQSPASR